MEGSRGLLRFAGTALLATAVDIGLLVVLAGIADWPVVAADAVALAIAALVSLPLHRRSARRDALYVRWTTDVRGFTVIGLVAALVDLAVLVVLSELVDTDAIVALFGAKVLAVAVAGLVRVAGHRRILHATVRADQEVRRDREPASGARRVSVVLPALDEADRIGDAVRAVRAALEPTVGPEGLEVVVVDDGSADGTAEAATAAGADQVIRHERNVGKGAAVRRGMLAATGRTRVFTDADLAYAPEQIVGLVEQVEDGWDLVVGSRRHADTTTLVRARRLREIGGRAINVLTQLVLLGQYRDTQCGLKAFRSDAAEILFGGGRLDGFAFDVELFHLAERHRLSLTEVPVEVTNAERSTVHVVRDAARLVRDLIRVRAWAEAGVYDGAAGPPERPTSR